MKAFRTLLLILVAIELVGASYIVGKRLNRANPPEIDSTRLDPLTQKDLEQLRIQARDGHALAWRRLAEGYLGNGYYLAAEQCFQYAAQLNPNDLQARYGQGFCLERIGQTQRAVPILSDIAGRAEPELAQTCWYQVGRCFLRQELPAQAEAAFRKTLSFPPAVYQLSKLLIRTGRAEEAIPLIDEQLASLPNSLKLIQLRRHAAESLGDRPLAEELRDREDRAEYQLVLEYNQNFISMFAAKHGLSKILSRALRLKSTGSLQERRAALEEALAIIRPHRLWQYRSVLIAAAHVEFGLENYPTVHSLLDEIEQYTHGDTETLDLHALVAQAQGDVDSAYRIWSRIVTMKPSSANYRTLAEARANSDQASKEHDLAMAGLYRAIELWQRNQVAEAAAVLERLEPLPDDQGLYWFYTGETRRVLGELKQALDAYEKCLEINPDHGRCLHRKQDVLRQLGIEADNPKPS